MSWKNFQSSFGNFGANVQQGVAGLNLNEKTGSFSKSFATFSQSARERFTTLEEDDVTELPQEYKDLERRVDALKAAHVALLRVTKVYATETYDYPTQIQESLNETASTVSHTLTSWAAAATKGTNIPSPSVATKAPTLPKTLPHALSRAAASGALEVGPSSGGPPGSDPLANALQSYAVAQAKVGDARLAQDQTIERGFLGPWQVSLNQGIQAAMKSRQAVKTSRLALDSARNTLKNSSGGAKQEHARLEVENAEEKLVTATEEAIGLMKRVLEDPEPIKAIAELVKAQQAYHAVAADTLQGIVGEVEDAGVKAEANFRKSRD